MKYVPTSPCPTACMTGFWGPQGMGGTFVSNTHGWTKGSQR